MAEPAQRPPRIVAELGRPETPSETAARKAESSRIHRSSQTLRNLVVALVASLAIVLFIVLVVVRPDGATRAPIDYRSVASQSQPTVSQTLAAPKLPSKWTANSASLETGADGIQAWSVGFITPTQQFIGLVQGIDANGSWLSDEVKKARSTGTVTIDGTVWTVYDRRSASDPGNYAYSLSTVIGASTVVLHGGGSTAEFRTLAAAISTQLGRDR
ncbi:DUF4245 domain-containing protein [Lacisediminihabitans changchengi]|uniref:DUF4245 domain-containing protein n=1 Tax=Lacisediminihabitans changchengi TaxID=2787634 RepID=A0A934SII2_9MICO|nr:DUF4245 domain-containing protein [Lacisediminihabitans changchengi]MBK4347286.1 DUF4245 domain-containing protein [Lacisediminihabitans changchengi]